jgi:type VI secretion system protein VasD
MRKGNVRQMTLDTLGRYQIAFVGTLVATGLAVGCAKAPPPKVPDAPLTIAAPADAKVKASMTVAASADANPDSSGRPSPVVVRVYQLRTDARFSNTEFFDLYDDEQKVLGPELISRDEYMVNPAQSKTMEITVAGDTRYVGAIAAFRDIRNSQWRGLVPAPRDGLTVSVERSRIVLTGSAK